MSKQRYIQYILKQKKTPDDLIKHQWLLILQKDTTDIMYLLMEEQNTLEAVLSKTKKSVMNIASRSTYQLTGSW